MIRCVRFFSNFVVENVRNGAAEADGKPARAKLKKIARGKPENVRRSARQFAGSPKKRNWA